MKKEITAGMAILFDGVKWGMVDDVLPGNLFLVIDQDGGEHEISESRIDHIY